MPGLLQAEEPQSAVIWPFVQIHQTAAGEQAAAAADAAVAVAVAVAVVVPAAAAVLLAEAAAAWPAEAAASAASAAAAAAALQAAVVAALWAAPWAALWAALPELELVLVQVVKLPRTIPIQEERANTSSEELSPSRLGRSVSGTFPQPSEL